MTSRLWRLPIVKFASSSLRLAVAGLFCVSLAATAFAESDRLTRCRSGDPGARITACAQIIARGKRETKRDQLAAYVSWGDAYLARSEFDRAIADYDKALRFDKNLAAAYTGRARAYRGKGDLEKAVPDFDEAVKLDPKSAQLRLDRAAVYEARGDVDRAIADYDEALARAPGLASAYNRRGALLSAKGEYDKALADFSKAIELDPKFAEAFVNEAKAYREKQELDRAKQDLETALRLNPQLASAKEALAEVERLIAERSAPPAQAAPPAPAPAAPVTYASPDRLTVVAIGLALIVFIVWFFWLKRAKGVRAAETSGGYQEAMILVKGGYTPDTIIVRSGKPVRLNFRREETASCSDKVIFADFEKSADLPTGETVAVEFLPKAPGEFGFACPMGMFRGTLVVE
jgi:tetratricopeptide (TPR) repeat protein